MIARILTFLLWAVLVALIVVWLLNGGWAKAKLAAQSFGNPVTAILHGTPWGGSFTLPGSPVIPKGADISSYTGDTAAQYDDLNAQMTQARALGSPSPYAGSVTISVGEAGTESEYVEIDADSGAGPLILTGWSLQSAFSGVRMPLPPAADLFVMGSGGNAPGAITLSSGGTLIVSSGASPVGVSFRENICTGYLGQLQRYAPSLSTDCPAPSTVMPRTSAGVSKLGASCFDYLASLPICTFPASMPSSLSSACRATLAERLSYNGCVRGSQSRPGFLANRWRLFLNAPGPLWNPSRDTIRLLDPQGQTVATYSY